MRYLKRHIDTDLQEWKNAEKRKPLLLRGARQVGKSSVLCELGKERRLCFIVAVFSEAI
jgi:predicted AAA+ superfamily ATPase